MIFFGKNLVNYDIIFIMILIALQILINYYVNIIHDNYPKVADFKSKTSPFVKKTFAKMLKMSYPKSDSLQILFFADSLLCQPLGVKDNDETTIGADPNFGDPEVHIGIRSAQR